VVVEHAGHNKPIGVARAADILRLRRWTIEDGTGNEKLESGNWEIASFLGPGFQFPISSVRLSRASCRAFS
jgi:hypothetical protein